MNQEQRKKSGFKGSGDFDSDLSVTHNVEVPSIEDVLRAAKQAIKAAEKTIEARAGDHCGCF